MSRETRYIIALVFLIWAVIFASIKLFDYFEPAEILPDQATETAPRPTVEMEPTLGHSPLTVFDQTRLPTNTPAPIVDYVFNRMIDLSSGKPVLLEISLPEGGVLPSTWAKTLAYNDGDPADIFGPNNGVIYSYKDEGFTVTWAHSGASDYGKPLFADNLDRYMRKTVDGRTMSLAMAKDKAHGLIGATAVFCQDESGRVVPLDRASGTNNCFASGTKVTLEVTAFTIVPTELVAQYDKISIGLMPWLRANFPEDGYETFLADDSWIVRFCLGGYYDQRGFGNNYFLNRAVIAFRVLK